MNERGPDILHTSLGLGGTGLAVFLDRWSPDAAALAGLLTAAWMARQLWLSFKTPKK